MNSDYLAQMTKVNVSNWTQQQWSLEQAETFVAEAEEALKVTEEVVNYAIDNEPHEVVVDLWEMEDNRRLALALARKDRDDKKIAVLAAQN